MHQRFPVGLDDDETLVKQHVGTVETTSGGGPEIELLQSRNRKSESDDDPTFMNRDQNFAVPINYVSVIAS